MPNNYLVNGLGNPTDQPRGPGFGEHVLGRNDDESTYAVDLSDLFPSGFKFFGQTYYSVYINNNGNVTFGNSLGEFIPTPIGSNTALPIIAPYWMDIDTGLYPRADGEFDTDTFDLSSANDTLEPGLGVISSGGNSQGTDLVYWDLDYGVRDGPPERPTFTVTWDDVGSYSEDDAHPNAFQLQIIQNFDGTFDIVFRYEATQQATSETNGPFEAARAGYAPAGTGNGFEIAGSGVATSMEQLASTVGNTGEAGYWVFHLNANGDVTNPLPAARDNTPDESPVAPRSPVAFSMGGQIAQNEGDTGITHYTIVIERDGGGTTLNQPSVVDWALVLGDPNHPTAGVSDLNDLATGQQLTGEVVFAPFQTTATVTIDVQGDKIYEPDETLAFKLTSVSFGGDVWDPDQTGTLLVLNDDPRNTVGFTGPQIRTEGAAGATPFDFVVQRTGDLSVASNVHWQLDLGTSTADAQDLVAGQPLSGDISFAAGVGRATIQVKVAGDATVEPDETFNMKLTSITTANLTTALDVSTTGTILDDDSRVSRLVATPTALVAPEGDAGSASFNFTVMRTGDLAAAATTPYAVVLASGGADASDFDGPLTGTLSFAAGASQATVTIRVHGDGISEDNEAFGISLGGGSFNSLNLTGVILNDDKATTTTSTAPSSIDDGSSFMHMLTGGGLWSDGTAI